MFKYCWAATLNRENEGAVWVLSLNILLLHIYVSPIDASTSDTHKTEHINSNQRIQVKQDLFLLYFTSPSMYLLFLLDMVATEAYLTQKKL